MTKKLEIRRANTFKKDLKLVKKRGFNISKLIDIITVLQESRKLPTKYRDHRLIGNYNKHRECHIEPDWLLIYKIDKKILELVRTGSHSDLFKNNLVSLSFIFHNLNYTTF